MARTPGGKTRAAKPGEANLGTPIAVAESCVRMWGRIVDCVPRMQNELEKLYDDCSSANGLLKPTSSVRFGNYTMLGKRLSGLLEIAQNGIQSAVAIRKFADVEEGDLSEWERAKLEFDPKLTDWLEKTASWLIQRGWEIRIKEHGQDTFQSSNLPPVRSNKIGSGARNTVDLIMQLRITEISKLVLPLQRAAEACGDGAARDGLSQQAHSAQFRKHSSEMKRLASMLLLSQRAFQSALPIKRGLKLEAGALAPWALEEQQFEKMRREMAEKMFLTVYERARIFKMSIPELDGLDSLLKAQATSPDPACRVAGYTGEILQNKLP